MEQPKCPNCPRLYGYALAHSYPKFLHALFDDLNADDEEDEQTQQEKLFLPLVQR